MESIFLMNGFFPETITKVNVKCIVLGKLTCEFLIHVNDSTALPSVIMLTPLFKTS